MFGRNDQLGADVSVPGLGANVLRYVCSTTGCGRSFPSARGLGVHQSRMHRNEVDVVRAQAARPGPKGRWSEEETNRMAKHEALLHRRGGLDTRINLELAAFLNGTRTVDAISGKRKSAACKLLRDRYCAELESSSPLLEGLSENPIPEYVHTTSNDGNNSTSTDVRGGSPTTVPAQESSQDDIIIHQLLERQLPSIDRLKTDWLQRIVTEAIESGKDATFSRLSEYLTCVLPRNVRSGGNSRRLRPSRAQAGPDDTGLSELAEEGSPILVREARIEQYASLQAKWDREWSDCERREHLGSDPGR